MSEKIEKIAKLLTEDPDVFIENDENNDWPESDELEEGSFTKWCKDNGHDGPGIACAKHAWKVAKENNDSELRGKVSFYMNTVKPGGHDLSYISGEDDKN